MGANLDFQFAENGRARDADPVAGLAAGVLALVAALDHLVGQQPLGDGRAIDDSRVVVNQETWL